jgi:hypothetical protein
MKNPLNKFSTATAAVCVLAAVLGGCTSQPPARTGSSAGGSPAAEQRLAELAVFKAVLTGRDTVPPSGSAGSGELVAVLDRNTSEFRWKLRYSGLSGTVRGAFHASATGSQTGAAVLDVGGRSLSSPYEGRAMLTSAQRDGLLAGQWYVNLRTTRFPNGELRGPLIEQH